MAKEKRKQKKRASMGGLPSPKDKGEEMPSFFLPVRYKLMFKILQQNKSCTTVGRKPIPAELKAEFVQASHEYHAYKYYEKAQCDMEENNKIKAHYKAMDACVFLPDYLLEECFSEWG
jgi:hypothetical protein